jgi:hypothetical protein
LQASPLSGWLRLGDIAAACLQGWDHGGVQPVGTRRDVSQLRNQPTLPSSRVARGLIHSLSKKVLQSQWGERLCQLNGASAFVS